MNVPRQIVDAYDTVIGHKMRADEVEAVLWVSEKDLQDDIMHNPEKYIDGFEVTIKLFVKGNKS